MFPDSVRHPNKSWLRLAWEIFHDYCYPRAAQNCRGGIGCFEGEKCSLDLVTIAMIRDAFFQEVIQVSLGFVPVRDTNARFWQGKPKYPGHLPGCSETKAFVVSVDRSWCYARARTCRPLSSRSNVSHRHEIDAFLEVGFTVYCGTAAEPSRP